MSPPGSSLAVLREPPSEEASRWHSSRKNPIAVRLKFLADFLLEDPTVRLVRRTLAATELLVATGNGTSLRLSIRTDSIDVRLGPYVVQDCGKLHPQDYVDEVSAIVEVLQVGSGFYVYSDELVGFEPKGACPACAIEVFDWQDACEVCEAKLHPLRPGEDEHDGRAERVVDFLLRHEMIELASPRGLKNVQRTVSTFYAYGGALPGVLIGIMMEMPDLAEVYCDEVQLGRVLRRVK